MFAQVTRGTLILLLLFIYILQIPIGILDILGFGPDLGGRARPRARIRARARLGTQLEIRAR